MPNPIPAPIRLWLYLIGTVVLTVAAGGVVPEEYFRLVMAVAAVLQILAAANVTPNPATLTPAPVEVVNEPVTVEPVADDYEPQHAELDEGDAL